MSNDGYSDYQLGRMGVNTGGIMNQIARDDGFQQPLPLRGRRSPKVRKPPPKWMTNPETVVEHAKLAGLNWLFARRQKWIFWLVGLTFVGGVIVNYWPAPTFIAPWEITSNQAGIWVRAGLAAIVGLIGWLFFLGTLGMGIPAITGSWAGIREFWPKRWFRAMMTVIKLLLSIILTIVIAAIILTVTGIMTRGVMMF